MPDQEHKDELARKTAIERGELRDVARELVDERSGIQDIAQELVKERVHLQSVEVERIRWEGRIETKVEETTRRLDLMNGETTATRQAIAELAGSTSGLVVQAREADKRNEVFDARLKRNSQVMVTVLLAILTLTLGVIGTLATSIIQSGP